MAIQTINTQLYTLFLLVIMCFRYIIQDLINKLFLFYYYIQQLTRMKKIMILGAYGNFGKIISNALAKHSIPIIIAGRNQQKLSILKNQLTLKYKSSVQISKTDINTNLKEQIRKLKPIVVVNTCGHFQDNNYSAIQATIQQKVNYIDLADGRQFVRNSTKFNQQALKSNVSVICGASSVPGLSSAVIQQYKHQFKSIDQVYYGISPGQKTQRGGIATVKAVMSYIGKPFKKFNCQSKAIYGWQDIYIQKYPELGLRLMGNCQVPDYDIFPNYYQIKKIKFSAGMESKLLHLSIWLTSWLIRIGMPIDLVRHSQLLYKFSRLFNFLGTNNGGMHVVIKGKDIMDHQLQRKWFIIVRNGDGPNVPTIPAIILAKKMYQGTFIKYGVNPCVGLVSLTQYLDEMCGYNFSVFSQKQ